MSTGRIGLACAGGVVEGAFYEIGVLCALQEAIEGLDLNRLDAYVGVSAGAIVVSSLANGITPETMSRVAAGDAHESFNLRPETLFTPALAEYGRRAGRVPGALARALARFLARPGDLSPLGAILELGSALPVGLFDNAPLERYLARSFSAPGCTNDFRRLPSALRIVAVNLDTAELVAFGDEATAHVPISRAVQASTALPVLYPPVEIDGEHYIDGVARRTLNASQALAAGAGLVLCINPIVPIRYRVPGRTLAHGGLPAVLSQTFRTIVHSRMQTGMRSYEHAFPDADLLLIEPEMSDQSMFFSNIFSFSTRRRVCEHGYRTTRAWLRRRAGKVAPKLERHGLRLRREALRGPGLGPFPEADRGTEAEEGSFGDAHRTLDRLDRALERLERR